MSVCAANDPNQDEPSQTSIADKEAATQVNALTLMLRETFQRPSVVDDEGDRRTMSYFYYEQEWLSIVEKIGEKRAIFEHVAAPSHPTGVLVQLKVVVFEYMKKVQKDSIDMDYLLRRLVMQGSP